MSYLDELFKLGQLLNDSNPVNRLETTGTPASPVSVEKAQPTLTQPTSNSSNQSAITLSA